ncbi:hypothetical protein [Marinithermus hydrothermalis]|uniref:Uncharacterized protein n=1 Tax=Marinithermus hydrothermalis (strain DSM 14884 / JCM 11576 / T1) TaxID=869210 RepID=F2NPF0_MARHT|nr:hypothetical protein [Marinithermus hydrothermalis]AEB12231.1 hypothetical protein Marky_1496 [Marinithermus hydrothermalis DSM 14884]
MEKREPFPGAYTAGLLITVSLLVLLVVVGSALPPAAAGFLIASLLGLTVNPKYAPLFLIAGVVSSALGFAGQEPLVAWGGVGLALASGVVWRWVRI